MAKNKNLKEGLATQAASAEADHELQMARSQLYKIAQYAIKLHEMMKQVTDPNGIEPWQAAKITKAADYMGAVYHNLDYKLNANQGGELGAEEGEIAVGESKVKEARRDYDSYGTFTGGQDRPGGKPSARDRGIDDDGDQAFIDKQKQKEAGTWYIRINGKLWKKGGKPVEFNGRKHANSVGLKLQKKDPNRKITVTPNANTAESNQAPTFENIQDKFAHHLGKKLSERFNSKKNSQESDMKINEVTQAKKGKLKENVELADIGRSLMDMAITQKDDELSNQMSSLGDALTRFGTNMGPKNIKDLVKQTGVDPATIQKMMAAAKEHNFKPQGDEVPDMDDDEAEF